MDTDDPPPAAAAAVESSSPLAAPPPLWDLQHGARFFLQRLRVLEPTQTLPTTTLKPDAPPIQLGWKPLVPIDDLSSLIAVIDSQHRPEDLPVLINESLTVERTRRNLLEALARLALDPALTAEVIIAFRPVAVTLVGRWIEALGLGEEGQWRQGQPGVEMAAGERDAVNKVWRAIVRALPILGDQVMP